MPDKSIHTLSLSVLAIFTTFVILKVGDQLFVPIVLALITGIVVSPLSNLWESVGIKTAFGALLTVITVLAFVTLLGILLEPYISEAIAKMPLILSELQGVAKTMKTMIRGLEEISDSVASAVEGPTANIPATAPDGAVIPSVMDALFLAPRFLAQLMIFVGTFYFFLLSRVEVYEWFGKTLRYLESEHLYFAERRVSRYLLTITAINATFGIIVGIVMMLYGMPSPILWGMLAFMVNFVLYLGPISLAVTLLITGIVVFDGILSFLPAATYMAMNATEGQFVTPALVGRSISVSPLLVFLSLVGWLWLWGPAGGIIAIPLLIWLIVVVKAVSGQNVETETDQ